MHNKHNLLSKDSATWGQVCASDKKIQDNGAALGLATDDQANVLRVARVDNRSNGADTGLIPEGGDSELDPNFANLGRSLRPLRLIS